MNSLAVFIFAVLLSNGVDCISLTDEDYRMADKLFTFGAEASLKYLDNLKTAAEFVVKEKQIKKTGNDMHDLWISLKEMIEKVNAEEKAKGHDDFIVALRVYKTLCKLLFEGLHQMGKAHTGDRTFTQYGFFKGIFNKKTTEELWKYVEFHFLPGAPPVYSNPMGFFSHIVSKILARPRVIEIIKVAGNIVNDINEHLQRFERAYEQFIIKVGDIITQEKEKENDEFLITLRTLSRLFVDCWDNVLEYTESQEFHNKYTHSLERWNELRALKDNGKRHKLFDSETGRNVWTWADQQGFSLVYDKTALEYQEWGNEIFGNNRFSQSNRALKKVSTIYGNALHERMSQYGLGMSEVNDFLIDVDEALTELLGEHIVNNLRRLGSELWNYFNSEILQVSKNKKSQLTSDEDPLQQLRKIKEACFDVWDRVLFEINKHVNDDGLEQSVRDFQEVMRVFIQELAGSGQLTERKLVEAEETLLSFKQLIFDKYVNRVDGLERMINDSAITLAKVMLKTFSATNTLLVNYLAFLMSD
ncbi:uncharacterized protein si:ch211-288g17.4 [Danio rerio]|uniref:Si:ch211-288g17.4 n=1 Tax=Danio rerio TaxID=7955 RepID=F6NMD4_DANRE|nr:uncharacterized protein si:ch211-288g17.4 [Danio rerio]|eukprot:XP_001333900.3 uncharacterized protein si:ch211-288g17.4 [Danio rerio]